MKKTLQQVLSVSKKQIVYYLPLAVTLLYSASAVATVCIRLEDRLETQSEAVKTESETRKFLPVPTNASAAGNNILAPQAISSTNSLVDSVSDRSESVDFEVQTISKNRFRISFNNNSGRSVFVKIYDVIGNLIRHEKINRKGKFRKDYDLSNTRTDFYVIEVGNENNSITKRLFPS